MSIKLDLHIHTLSQGKVLIDHDNLRQALDRNGVDGVAITNFFDISHAVWLRKMLPDKIIIVGQEVWTKEGHIIGLGLNEQIPDFIGAEDAIRLIHKQGGIAVAPQKSGICSLSPSPMI